VVMAAVASSTIDLAVLRMRWALVWCRPRRRGCEVNRRAAIVHPGKRRART
jgi:hypothetical protein